MTHEPEARYLALLDRSSDGGWGVAFPDLDNVVAMGATRADALANAAEALRETAELTEARGGRLPAPRSLGALMLDEAARQEIAAAEESLFMPLIRSAGRSVRVNLSIDVGVLAALDGTAERLGTTRSGLVELLARRRLAELG